MKCRLLHGWNDTVVASGWNLECGRRRFDSLCVVKLKDQVLKIHSGLHLVYYNVTMCCDRQGRFDKSSHKLNQFKKLLGLEALDAALKSYSGTGVIAVKLLPGMFITTHPWPFWALLPVYRFVGFFKGHFIAWFKDMELWGPQQTALIFSNSWLDISTYRHGHVTVDTELLKVWQLASEVMRSARGCVCATRSVRSEPGGGSSPMQLDGILPTGLAGPWSHWPDTPRDLAGVSCLFWMSLWLGFGISLFISDVVGPEMI